MKPTIDDIRTITPNGVTIYYSKIDYFAKDHMVYNGQKVEADERTLKELEKGKNNYELLKLQISQTDLEERVNEIINQTIKKDFASKFNDILSFFESEKTNAINAANSIIYMKNNYEKASNIFNKLVTDLDKFQEKYNFEEIDKANEEYKRALIDARYNFNAITDQLKGLLE